VEEEKQERNAISRSSQDVHTDVARIRRSTHILHIALYLPGSALNAGVAVFVCLEKALTGFLR
jgi:hypothetical protein